MLVGLLAVSVPSLLWAAGSPYGIKGTELPTIHKSGATTCYAYGKYYVQTTESKGSVGEDIRVTARKDKGISCGSNVPKVLLVLKNTDAAWFAGLSGSHLLVDNGTDPSGRTLAIYDLSSGKKVYSVAYEGEITLKNGATLSFLQPLGPVKSITKCPNANDALKAGMPDVVLAEQVQLNLLTQKLTQTGTKECVPVQ